MGFWAQGNENRVLGYTAVLLQKARAWAYGFFVCTSLGSRITGLGSKARGLGPAL